MAGFVWGIIRDCFASLAMTRKEYHCEAWGAEAISRSGSGMFAAASLRSQWQGELDQLWSSETMPNDKGSSKLREPFAKFIETELGTGFLLIACGLPGTWKTETTEEVSKIKGYSLLRTDLIRLEVLKNEDIFDEKVASNMNKRKWSMTRCSDRQMRA